MNREARIRERPLAYFYYRTPAWLVRLGFADRIVIRDWCEWVDSVWRWAKFRKSMRML